MHFHCFTLSNKTCIDFTQALGLSEISLICVFLYCLFRVSKEIKTKETVLRVPKVTE